MLEKFNGFGEINLEEILNVRDNKNYNSTLDLNYKVKISKKEAIEGVTVKIKTKGGELKVRLPNNIKNGQTLLLIGEGKKRGKQYGDLKITVVIK